MFDAMVAPVRPRRGTARLPPSRCAFAFPGEERRNGTGRGGEEKRGEEEPGGGPDSTWHRLGYGSGDTENGERQGTGTGSGRWRSTGHREHRAPGTQGDLGMGEPGTGELPRGYQGGEPAPARVGGSCPGVHPEAGGDAEQSPLGARGFGVRSAACWRSSPAAAPTLSSPWLRACLDLGTPAGLCSHLCWRLSSGQSFAAFSG